MDIYRCQKLAQKIGFDNAVFKADFPSGTFNCKWLDAYLGFLRIESVGLRDIHLCVDQVDEMFPELNCHSLTAAA